MVREMLRVKKKCNIKIISITIGKLNIFPGNKNTNVPMKSKIVTFGLFEYIYRESYFSSQISSLMNLSGEEQTVCMYIYPTICISSLFVKLSLIAPGIK